MRSLALLVLVGCGRVDFDPLATIYSAGGHDEDEDGLPDSIDRCPHVAGDNADGDGDKVGDACDPNPNEPRERFLVFATMQPGDVPFDPKPGLVQGADEVVFAGDTIGIGFDKMLGTVRFDMGFDINALVGTGQHQIAAGIENNAMQAPFYFIELNENSGGATKTFALVRYDGTYTSVATMMHGGMHPGRGLLRFDAKAGNDATFRSTGGWIGEMYVADGATPGYVGGTYVRVAINGLSVAMRYLVLIETT
jgi:hypothetical protein